MAEIVKINEQILEYYQNFDNQLFGLHQRKVKTHQAIFQVKVFFGLGRNKILKKELKLNFFFCRKS